MAQIVMICHKPAFQQRREAQAVAQVGRRDVDQPGVERALHGRAPEDQDCSEKAKKAVVTPKKPT
jgi:hypothetical protein